ncbi:MAG: hypothetical protein EOO88_55270, partial [Pedobacter sp.]
MIVSMQGNWTVTVKSKSAAYPQRFIITGSTNGKDGSYAGTVGTNVSVMGTQWSIAIQNDDGTGYQLSDTKINFPIKTGTLVQFDIQSNDAGSDKDFNDLVLTCSSAFSESDFLIYGNVTRYTGCLINPCIRKWLVIDSYAAFKEAMKNRLVAESLRELYPERIPVGP